MAALKLGLEIAFYLYPVGLFAALFAAQVVVYRWRAAAKPLTLDQKGVEKIERFYSRITWVLQLLLVPTLLASIALVLHNAIASHDIGKPGPGFPYSAYLASYVGVLLYYLAGLLPDPGGPWLPDLPHGCAWAASFLVEAVISAILFSEQELIPLPTDLVGTLFGLGLGRLAVLGLMIALLAQRRHQVRKLERLSTPEESQSLLENGDSSRPAGYGGVNGSASGHAATEKGPQTKNVGWFDYIAGFKILFPYLWPADSPLHQATVLACVVLLIIQRLIQVAVPVSLGMLVDTLGYGHIPYKEIVIYLVCRGLQGGQGIISATRSVLWIPVSQGLFRRLSCAAFEHVLGLSMDFHLSKRIGEVTSALSRGAAMNTFLESFLFQVFPMLFDIFIAGIYFFFFYDAFYTLIVFIIMWTYVYLTMYMAKWRATQRRDMATKAREMDAAKTDAIMAYETVQHNCAVRSETDRFKSQVTIFQQAERLVQLSLNLLNVTQSSIFTLGTALIVAVSAYKISIGQQKVSEFVTLISYFAQLQGPLNFFGSYYTMLQNTLIEAERMLDLFKETSGVVERPDAKPLETAEGEVKFNDVTFSYQGKEPAIDGISFAVPPGTTTALVGESGSGKSTCLKLLYRFYDVNSGSVTVDGHDIRDLKLDSVRSHIGVVPQDTVLFNATIMYNLQYANPNATEADVYAATKAANIHERIMAFPDQYNTKVGERGLKLSGGERQRIAIARAILKDARILLLDEATASLDSHTERLIQGALEKVTEGRTTIVIAHRLSTIIKSDQILVLHKGKVIERGTHAELLAVKGKYHAMWEKQTNIENENAGKETSSSEE